MIKLYEAAETGEEYGNAYDKEVAAVNALFAELEGKMNITITETTYEHVRKMLHELLDEWQILNEKLKSAESLAARLSDQEAIERHVAKRVSRECAEIADIERRNGTVFIGDVIRQKYGVE